MTEKDDERKTQAQGTQEAENWEANLISVLPLQHEEDTACPVTKGGEGIWEVGPTWVTDGHRPSLSSIPTATTWTLLSQSSS